MNEKETMLKKNRGVYFLANDRVFDLAIAFLNSFRQYNPDIPLCLIPFDNEFSRIKQMQTRYNFSIYTKMEICKVCDEISKEFHGYILGAYRKLAIWEGDFEEFVYIDVDTVVLENIGFVFEFLSEYEFLTSHSNISSIIKFVWQESIYRSGRLTKEQIEYAASTGFIASKKHVLRLDTIKANLADALQLASHMTLYCMEQPFLNFLIVTSGQRYSSLRYLYYRTTPQEIRLEHWAGGKGGRVTNGRIVFTDNRPPTMLVHWAGKWQPTRSDRLVSTLLRRLRIKKSNILPTIRFFMPYKKLWRHYRFLHDRKTNCQNTAQLS